MIVYGSGPPFPFRIGQAPDRELRVNVKEFKIRNQTKTSNERQAAADQVPPSLTNEPAPIRDLADRLEDLTTTIAKTARFEDLRENLKTTWKLKLENFLDLKAATDSLERRDNLRVQIAAAFKGLLRDGVLGPGTLPLNEESSRVLSIRNVGEPPDKARHVARERVVPERIVKPDGPVYQEFCSAFTTPRVGAILFSLIDDQLDKASTLSFETAWRRPNFGIRRETRLRTIMTPIPGARFWSTRDRTSRKSNSSYFGWSTTRPCPS